MAPSYRVDWTRPVVYLDNAGQAVDGIKVRITLLPWNEARDLDIPDDEIETIQAAAQAALDRRIKIDELSGPPEVIAE